ncbi:hypothetical protein I4U23_024846 [Adineta vaga]|nr:hypothetical protein I4U23_024846 [Adineta vaga]
MTSTTERISSNIFLVEYFIYCPLLCEKEGQEERKILYYYPAETDIDRKIRTVGYCEGLVKFTETFGFDDVCDSVHFQKSRLLFHKVEQDISIAMSLHVPVIERKRDDKFIIEYYDEHINDRIMLPLLKISYQYFALQHGTMSSAIRHGGVEELRNVLKQHFDKFIQHHLHTMIRDATLDASYLGVQFLPVEKKLYLKLQSILRRLELRFSSLKETFFLYKDQLIWSGLSQDDTSLVYSFFRLYYWPHLKQLPISSTPQFLTVDSSANPADELIISSQSTSEIYQAFFLENSLKPYRILVININLITIFCFFHNDNELTNDENTNAEIVETLKKEFDTMLPNFEEHLRKKYPSTDNTVRTVYYNKMNMAHSSTVDWTREPISSMTGIMNTLAEDMQWFHPSGEIMVKRENDPWIIAKRSDMRELLIVVNQRNANLKEISDKVKQIFATQFTANMVNTQDESTSQTSTATDELTSTSRFQMIRVDRKFGRGRWKVNDYEPPENISSNTNVPVAPTIENEPNSENQGVPTNSIATAAQQRRPSLYDESTVALPSNIPSQVGHFNPYPPSMIPNQAYHQFGYYSFYPSPYLSYANPWATAMAAPNPYMSSLDTDTNGDPSTTFPNLTVEQIHNAHLAAAINASYLYGTHPPFMQSTSPYATISSYHSAQYPRLFYPTQSFPMSQTIPTNTLDSQQSPNISSFISSKNDTTNGFVPLSPFVSNPEINSFPNTTTNITDLSTPTSSEPLLIPSITMNNINSPTTSLTDLWKYSTTAQPLSLTQTTQTAAVTVAAAMSLLNNENNQNTNIASELLKGILATPTKQDTTFDIDNKISAAMDLVKMHLLSAVREEVTELRQQIQQLRDKLNSTEHENTFLRQYVSNEIYTQYIPPLHGLLCSPSSSSDESTASLSASSQPIPEASLSLIPSSSDQQAMLLINNLPIPFSIINPILT